MLGAVKGLPPRGQHKRLGRAQAHLELDARFSHSTERVGLPICLLHLFPHDHIEARAVLVAKDETCVVVVCGSVHVERAFKVHTIEGCVTWRGTRIVGSWKTAPSPNRALACPTPHPSRVQLGF